MSIISDWTREKGAAFGRRTLAFTHDLHERPLFTDEGQPTRYLQSIVWSLRHLKSGFELTDIFITRLLQLKLIEPVDIEVQLDDGTARKVTDPNGVRLELVDFLPDSLPRKAIEAWK